MAPESSEITELLGKAACGDRDAESRLVPLVYTELRRLAGYFARGERPEASIQPTEIVHEAYLRLIRRGGWEGRSHFFAIASKVMRNILVDRARSANARKRGGGNRRVPLDAGAIYVEERPDYILAVDEALERLAQFDPRQSRIVEMRFFGGLTNQEIAEDLQISARTVKREWSMAKAWLHGEISGDSLVDA